MRTHRVLSVLLGVLVALGSTSAFAKKKKAKKHGGGTASSSTTKQAPAPKANAQAMAAIMGPFKWGMSSDDVLKVLEAQIADRYADQIKNTNDMYEKKRLRGVIKDEVDRVKKSYTTFDQAQTGWDVSIVDREFGHKNGESMLVFQEIDPASKKEQQRYFFFVDGKLWKMFIAFNMDVFQGKSFTDFSGMMQDRFGKAATQMKTDATGAEKVDYIYWRGGGYYLRAIDLTEFYGNFALAISDDSVEKTIYSRRQQNDPQANKPDVSPMTNQVLKKDADDQAPPPSP